MTTRVTETMLYHFVRSLVDNWEARKGTVFKQEAAVMLVESLVATLDRIAAQESRVVPKVQS